MAARGAERPLRLGFIADPNSIHTRRWIGWFARAGHDVHLVDPFGVGVDSGLAPEIQVHRLDLPAGPPVVGLVRRRRDLRGVLHRIGIEVLHGQFVRRYGWQAALSGFHPLIISPWGSDLLQVRRRSFRTRWWNRFALRAADLITVSSEGMRAAAIRAGAEPGRIEHVHHGVDTERFAPARTPRAGANHRILSIRGIRPLYRHETIIDAVAMLREAGLRPELVMVRFGADAAYLERLLDRARERGIADQLVVTDAVAHDDLPDLYRSADLLVSVPETDSFPVTLLEGMACGLPAVVSDLPAVSPVYRAIHPLAAELVVEVGDAAATSRAIRRALELGEGERADLAARLRAFVVETADYDTHMRRMETFYRSLAGR
ncbi:MAG: glycosyltransferase family 4 protein [Candidatus Limnocylindria bacterium]